MLLRSGAHTNLEFTIPTWLHLHSCDYTSMYFLRRWLLLCCEKWLFESIRWMWSNIDQIDKPNNSVFQMISLWNGPLLEWYLHKHCFVTVHLYWNSNDFLLNNILKLLSNLSPPADTARALGLLEDYCSKLRKPEEQQLKTAIQRVMGIFRSSLFQALLGRSTGYCYSSIHKTIHPCCYWQ